MKSEGTQGCDSNTNPSEYATGFCRSVCSFSYLCDIFFKFPALADDGVCFFAHTVDFALKIAQFLVHTSQPPNEVVLIANFIQLKRSACPDTKPLKTLCVREHVFLEAFASCTCLIGDFDFLACFLQALCVLVKLFYLPHGDFCLRDDVMQSYVEALVWHS